MPEEGKLIGKVTHYFGNIGVAIIELSDKLKVGETIRIIGSETEFDQIVDSIEIDRQKTEEGKPGDSIGLKVDQKVREGHKVYRV